MKLLELFRDKNSCCGCGACMEVCPAEAITMRPDEYGFLYPVIDEALCLDCGACAEACQYHREPQVKKPLEAYAAFGKDEALTENSSSGGVFAVLAKKLVGKGGLAAGAVLEREKGEMRVFHRLGSRDEDVLAMQGSKYVQSEAYRCYDEVQAELKKGSIVLFSGTPCQVAAMKQLSGDPDNLLTVDIVCHGVPSQKMLADFLRVLGKRLGKPVRGLKFRTKYIRKDFCAEIDCNGRKYYLQHRFLSYYTLFLEGKNYRNSCYICPYARIERAGDITIGDYWGIEEVHKADIEAGRMPQRNDWSCLLVNTEKGRAFLEENAECLWLFPTREQLVAENNGQLNRPYAMPEDRAQIMELYANRGYPALEEYYIDRFGGKFVFYRRMLKNLLINRKNAAVRNSRDV